MSPRYHRRAIYYCLYGCMIRHLSKQLQIPVSAAHRQEFALHEVFRFLSTRILSREMF